MYGARGIPSTYSGYETFLTVLLPGLVKRGHDVTIYCRKGDVDDALEFQGVRKRFLPAVETKALSTLTHGALSCVQARRARHDVVLVVNVANALFCGLSRWTGQPVVLNTDGQEWLRGKWGRAARGFFRISAHIASRMTTALVSDCASMSAVYSSEFSAGSTVIPYCWTGLESSPPSAILADLGLSPGRYFCQAGRLNPENKAVALAEAFTASDSPWPLVILGRANYDSPVATRLAVLAARDNRIRLIGHVADRSDYACLVRHAGAYFHTHSIGGINPSLIEAMGLGAYVLALNTPFNVDALGSAGRYFDDLGGGLTQVIESTSRLDPSATSQSRHDAEERARSYFSASAVIDEYERLLVDAAGRKWRGSGLVRETQWTTESPTNSRARR